MSLRGGSWTSDPRKRSGEARFVQQRRATRDGRLAEATLACARCDAPVAVGPGPRGIGDELTCPFCDLRAPIRDFLQLGRPTRPTRVVLRIGFGGAR